MPDNIPQTLTVPQRIGSASDGVMVAGLSSGVLPPPAPLASEVLAYFSLDPVPVGAQTIFTDASLERAVVEFIVQVANGCAVALWDGPSGNPGLSTLVFGVNGGQVPGLTSVRLNCKQKVGPDMWILTAGIPGVQLFVSYTGTQQ